MYSSSVYTVFHSVIYNSVTHGVFERFPFTKVNQAYSSYTGQTVQERAALSVLYEVDYTVGAGNSWTTFKINTIYLVMKKIILIYFFLMRHMFS